MALSGWSNRLKLIIDSSKIDEDVGNFPVLIVLSSSTGQGSFDATDVFDELTISGSSYTSRKKIAITTSDEETQCYVEIERWDHTNEEAYLWTKIPTVVSGTDTNVYFYYDKDKPDNDSYVGDSESTPGQTVWDSSFKMVQHMGDDTTSTIVDSTSNNNDGSKTSANNPIEAAGIIGQAQDFSSDEIVVTDHASLDLTNNFMIEACVNIDDLAEHRAIISKFWDGSTRAWHMTTLSTGVFHFVVGLTTTVASAASSAVTDTNIYVAILNDGTNYQFYVNGVVSGSSVAKVTMDINDADVSIGDYSHTSLHQYMDGIEDEVRVSSFTGTERNASWIKATYYSNWNDLITYSQSTYYFSGYIYEEGAPVSRTLYLHNRTDGSLVATTTSSGDGYYYLETTFSDLHYIVCLDDEAGADYNDMILGNMFPLVVT